jgi:hypothetical protein
MATGQELNYNTGASALDMALEIFGAGTLVVDATYTGWSQSSAIFHRRRQHRPRCDALRTAGSSSRQVARRTTPVQRRPEPQRQHQHQHQRV